MYNTDLLSGSFSKTSQNPEGALSSATEQYNKWLNDVKAKSVESFQVTHVQFGLNGVLNFTYAITATVKK